MFDAARVAPLPVAQHLADHVVAHWVETGPGWQGSGAGSGEARTTSDLVAERELWRVEAGRGLQAADAESYGVFDLSFDWTDGRWQLVGCLD